MVSPFTVHVSAGRTGEHVLPPGAAVTVYAVIGEPPSDMGVSQDTSTEVLPGTPTTDVGASGTDPGVIGLDGFEAGPVATLLVAVIVNVYEVPLASPITVQLTAGATAPQVLPPGDAVAV